LAGIPPLLRLMLFRAGTMRPVEPQVPVRLSGLAMMRPLGRLSVKATPVRSVATFGLVIVKVSVELWLSPIVVGENDLAIVGGD